MTISSHLRRDRIVDVTNSQHQPTIFTSQKIRMSRNMHVLSAQQQRTHDNFSLKEAHTQPTRT